MVHDGVYLTVVSYSTFEVFKQLPIFQSILQKYNSNVDVHTLNLVGRYSLFDHVLMILWVNFYVLFWRSSAVNIHYVTTYGAVGIWLLTSQLYSSVWGSDILIRPRRSKLARLIVKIVLRRFLMLSSPMPYPRKIIGLCINIA